ncbi:multicopper oxidase-domain-containing protein [Xylaria scruposa]|nr:multicopper oxidase-domain-containing protein [Xylaria scruposa]
MFFSKLFSFAAALPPSTQNGSTSLWGTSLWGTFNAPTLPSWMSTDSLMDSFTVPWGHRTSHDSNPYTEAPVTQCTRRYDFNISRGVIAPDGYEKRVILVNGQFPGPLIAANWGDYIEVNVHNNILDEPQEGTGIHWHGFLQTANAWEDGTPGVSQCPIAPGKSFTYKFRAELYGTSWYHSHYSAQYASGLFGPIVVYGPRNAAQDIDLGPIIVGDWWHEEYYSTVKKVMAPGFEGRAYSDNNLINGRMNFDCSTVDAGDTTKCTNDAELSKFKFQSGKAHRLRFINSGAEGVQRISIDEHTMTVIANDFVEMEPYDTQVVTLGIGQRVDVIVKANNESTGAYWLRSNLTSCSNAKQPFALAAIYYDKADTQANPTSTPWDVPDPGTCANDDLALTKPSYPMKLPEPSWTQNMDISVTRNESGILLWQFGGVAARLDYNNPTLLQVKDNNFEFEPEMNVMNFGSNSSIRFIVNNPTPAPHPMHAHGVNMYILSAGPGNYSDTPFVRPENPVRRDVQMVEPFGHVVVQIDSTNPGVWPFHCHIAWHASAGFFSQMIFQPDEIISGSGANGPFVPPRVSQTCRDWDAFTKQVVLDQIDSGF